MDRLKMFNLLVVRVFIHLQHSYMLTGTGDLVIYNQGKNSHSGSLRQKCGQHKSLRGLAIMGHGVEEWRTGREEAKDQW